MPHNKNVELRYAEFIRRLKAMRLIDDGFMSVAFKDKKCTQSVLRAVLNKPSLVVKEVLTQAHTGFFNGRRVRFDIFAADDNGKSYDIEIQRLKSGFVATTVGETRVIGKKERLCRRATPVLTSQ